MAHPALKRIAPPARRRAKHKVLDLTRDKLIEAAGYSSVHSITPSLDGYTARAMESGQSVVVDVDGNGNVYRVPNQH